MTDTSNFPVELLFFILRMSLGVWVGYQLSKRFNKNI